MKSWTCSNKEGTCTKTTCGWQYGNYNMHTGQVPFSGQPRSEPLYQISYLLSFLGQSLSLVTMLASFPGQSLSFVTMLASFPGQSLSLVTMLASFPGQSLSLVTMLASFPGQSLSLVTMLASFPGQQLSLLSGQPPVSLPCQLVPRPRLAFCISILLVSKVGGRVPNNDWLAELNY